jgi:3,4-dihydroxy 2-butanone 4-phosphate synthase/GTP cyclohydrolase II
MQHSIELTLASLRRRITESGIPRTRLALKAGLSEMALRNYDRPDWNPNAATIRLIEAFLDAEDRREVRDCAAESKRPAAQRPASEAA